MATQTERLEESIRLHSEKAALFEQQALLNEQARIHMLSSAEQQKALNNQLLSDYLANRKIGFALQDTLMDKKDAPVTLLPRFETLAEAEAFSFSEPADYGPEGCFVDLSCGAPKRTNWWSEPAPTQFTGKQSVYANISVGVLPHPMPKPQVRIAVLVPSNSAHNSWLLSGEVHDYTMPRVMNSGKDDVTWANGLIKGQSYDVSNYNDLLTLIENGNSGMGIGSRAVRIINLGPEPIHVKGFWIFNHAMMVEPE